MAERQGHETNTGITVGIATRNRLDSLIRCVKSLELIGDLVNEIIIVDDCSDTPVERPLREACPLEIVEKLRVIRQPKSDGYIVGRNRMARFAAQPYLLSLDDDAVIVSREAVVSAIEVMRADPKVGAVAFAQADAAGRPWPEAAQPSRARRAAYVTAFIGFATLLRVRIFRALGGYRERFYYYGEEKEYCLRLLDAGFHVVYLPDAPVAHLADPAGRDGRRYVRYAIRNDCLGDLLTLPAAMVPIMLAKRFWGFFRMSSGLDPAGFAWIVKEVFSALFRLPKERRPVRWSTIRRWTDLKRNELAYEGPRRG
jgi:GT2 family glycosyltransferase